MRVRVLTMSAAAAALAATSFALPVAHAGPIPTGPPPPPVAHNGHHLQLVASGLKTPTSFAIGGGHIFAGDGGNSEGSAPPNGGLYVLKGGAAVHVPSPYKFVAGVAWHNHALYVSGGVLTAHGPSWRLMKFKGWTGTKFTTRRLLYTAPKKFDGFNGLGFGANGRLYVGVDVGLTDGNDHGPRGTSPHVYQILSFNSHGKNLQVFASHGRWPSRRVRARRTSPTSARTGPPASRTRRTSSCGSGPVTTSASRSATTRSRRTARATPSRSGASGRTPT
jgi:hypothetical protein